MDDWNVAGWQEVGKSTGNHLNEENNSQFFSLFFYTCGSSTFQIQWPLGECVLKSLFRGCRLSSLYMHTPGMSLPDSRVIGLEPHSTSVMSLKVSNYPQALGVWTPIYEFIGLLGT